MPRLVDKEETMTTIGFVGLGNMGSGIASNLMAGGHEIVAWNRSPGKVDDLVAKGARRAASAGAAFDAEVVFSMLADDAAIEAVIVASGALDAARPGATHVNLSTISISLARRLEALHCERGLGYVAAPVLGRPDAAAAGQLVILPAGDPAAVEKVRPLLELFARRVWPVGDEAYRANVIKLGCNFALAAMIETLGEAGALAAAHGVRPKGSLRGDDGDAVRRPRLQDLRRIDRRAPVQPGGLRDAPRVEGCAARVAGRRREARDPADRLVAKGQVP